MRGEYGNNEGFAILARGSPPHVRGIANHHKVHPRMRGEYENGRNRPGGLRGSPPTCAGNSIHLMVQHLEDKVHPRMRGEYLDADP